MKDYDKIEAYMLECMRDSAHDREHIYRVLYTALDIAESEPSADLEILTAACLLHDIGRPEQFADPNLCHAEVGSKKAYDFLIGLDWAEERAAHVRDCVYTHRFRSNATPHSIEAKILFDADKIDVSGAVGMARSLMYHGAVGEPLYTTNTDGIISDGSDTDEPSFFREYHFKLKNIYGKFFTERGKEIALGRQRAADDFYNALLSDVKGAEKHGRELLRRLSGR